jgi:hypothetical protein
MPFPLTAAMLSRRAGAGDSCATAICWAAACITGQHDMMLRFSCSSKHHSHSRLAGYTTSVA